MLKRGNELAGAAAHPGQKSVTLIMPMAGAGSRFFKDGVVTPKPLIELNDRYFFEIATRAITDPIFVNRLVFAVLKDHVENFRITAKISTEFPNAEFVEIEKVLNGPIHTLAKTLDSLDDNGDVVLVNDCDHYFQSSALVDALTHPSKDELENDSAVLTFRSRNTNFSYVAIRADGAVAQIAEKKVISDDAVCGTYIFKSLSFLRDNLNSFLKSHAGTQEIYISHFLQWLIDHDRRVTTFATDLHIPFGTPAEYKQAQAHQALLR